MKIADRELLKDRQIILPNMVKCVRLDKINRVVYIDIYQGDVCLELLKAVPMSHQ